VLIILPFNSPPTVTEAIREYNHIKFAGKPCRVMQPKRGITKGPPEANVFVQDLPLALSAIAFHDTFAEFGEILSSRLSVDRDNVSKGYGFIQYATAEQAQEAIAETNGSLLDVAGGEKPIRASIFVKRDAPPSPTTRAATRDFKNLFFRNLPADITLDAFKATWSKYGVITSAVLTLDENGKPTGTAFASFQNHSDALRVIKATHRKGPNEVYAVRALSKTERARYKSRKDAKATEASTSA
jgi:polyadenylate-binding protein